MIFTDLSNLAPLVLSSINSVETFITVYNPLYLLSYNIPFNLQYYISVLNLLLYQLMIIIIIFYVHLVPAPNVTVDPEVTIIIYNSTFNLTCVVISLTVPNITWSSTTIAGLPSQPPITSHIATHTSILTLEQVKLNNTGIYTCTAVNEGGTNTATTNITIVGKEYDKIKIIIAISLYTTFDDITMFWFK